MKRRLDRVTVLDILLVAALLALPGWTLVQSWRTGGRQRAAYVYQGGRLIGVYPLDREQVVLIGDRAKPHMRLGIRDGGIRVAESDCPKGVCRHAGWVGMPGRSIVCLPNRVLVEVHGGGRDYDAESY